MPTDIKIIDTDAKETGFYIQEALENFPPLPLGKALAVLISDENDKNTFTESLVASAGKCTLFPVTKIDKFVV